MTESIGKLMEITWMYISGSGARKAHLFLPCLPLLTENFLCAWHCAGCQACGGGQEVAPVLRGLQSSEKSSLGKQDKRKSGH